MFGVIDALGGVIAALALGAHTEALLAVLVAFLIAALILPVVAEAASPALGALARAGVWLLGAAVALSATQYLEAAMVAQIDALLSGLGGW